MKHRRPNNAWLLMMLMTFNDSMCLDANLMQYEYGFLMFLDWETGTESMDILDTCRYSLWGQVQTANLGPLLVLLCERCVHWEIECDLDLHVHFWTTTSVSCETMSFQICKAGHNGLESHKLSQMFCVRSILKSAAKQWRLHNLWVRG